MPTFIPFARALRKALLVALLLLVPAATVSTAYAKRDQAAQQFSDGRKLYKKKRYAKALVLFRKAFEATGSPNARLYLARSLHKLGRLAEAYDEMQATLEDARSKAESDRKYVKTRDSAAAELALIEPKVGKLVLALSTTPRGLEITINDEPLEAARVGKLIVVDPGTKTIVAKAPGMKTVTEEADVGAGQTTTVMLVLTAAAGAEPDEGTETDEPDEPDETATTTTGGDVRVAGFVVAGVGVASLVVFAITAAEAKSNYDTLDEECGGARCTDPAYADTVDTGQTMETLSHVTLAIGIAGAAAGAAMIIFGGPTEEPAQAASISPVPGGVMMSWGGVF